MKKTSIKWLGVALAAVSLNCAAAYPEKSLSIVVGYSAGGTTDILTRVLAEELSKQIGQSVVVENKPGANENIGAAYVEKSRPDGYTLFLGTISQAINPILYKNAVDPLQAFEPVSMTAAIPLLLITNDKLPPTDFASFVEYAKANPGKLNYASSGNGSPGHLGAELFKSMANVDAMHIPFKGGAIGNTAVMSGDVHFSFATMPGAAPLVEANRVKALAVTTKERSAKMPDLPAVDEIPGFKGFEVNTWNALFVPKGTPPEVIEHLNKSVAAVMKSDRIKESYLSHGAVPQSSSPQELNQFLVSELDRWKGVVAKANLKID